ncbi:MAG: spore germination protein [Clostridiaceae bacterium]|nr:spore germination protein [Clostridiaceae bacterium]
MKLSGNYEQDLKIIDNMISGDPTIKIRDFEARKSGLRCRIYMSDGMVSSQLISDGIIEPIITYEEDVPKNHVLDWLGLMVLELPEVQRVEETSEMISALCYGDVLLFAEGQSGCLIVGCKNFAYRSIDEPDGEKVAKGPREGFVEPLMINLSMLKRRLRTNKLKIEMLTIGEKTGTSCCLCYIDGVTDGKLLNEIRQKMEEVKIDGVLSTNYVAEMITPTPFEVFKRMGATARPDVAVAKMLEGRVLIMVDGSPQALTIPFIFFEYFQSPEDYYVNYHHATFSRILRMCAFIVTISIVPIYLAILNFHPGMLPVQLMMSIAATQQVTPFSSLAEALILLVAFDLLREAGLRAPAGVGQALSIVGALVLGQSAVEAKLVSPAMVIIMALTGVTGLIINDLNSNVIILRLILIFFSNYAGLWGFVIGTTLIFSRLSVIESFGVDYLSSMPFVGQGSHEDSLFRMPLKFMKKSGRFIAKDGDK